MIIEVGEMIEVEGKTGVNAMMSTIEIAMVTTKTRLIFTREPRGMSPALIGYILVAMIPLVLVKSYSIVSYTLKLVLSSLSTFNLDWQILL